MKFGLELSAQLENCTDLRTEDEDFRWYMKLKCTNCGEGTNEFVYLTLVESQPLKGGRGSASLVLKCKLCRRDNSIDIIKDSLTAYKMEDVPKFKRMVSFDSRGIEPTTFDPRMGWRVTGLESGKVFLKVDLSDDWAEYDEDSQVCVEVTEVKFKLVKL